MYHAGNYDHMAYPEERIVLGSFKYVYQDIHLLFKFVVDPNFICVYRHKHQAHDCTINP